MSPFALLVSDLIGRPGARRRDGFAAPLAEDLSVVGSSVPAGTDVCVDVLLEWVTDGLLASGTVMARRSGECRRCLEPVRGDVEIDFQELFEAKPREGETYRLGHETIDLQPLVRDALLCELPLAPVCREACKGLCPTCGADLNVGACYCPSVSFDPRWAALGSLVPVPEAGGGEAGPEAGG